MKKLFLVMTTLVSLCIVGITGCHKEVKKPTTTTTTATTTTTTDRAEATPDNTLPGLPAKPTQLADMMDVSGAGGEGPPAPAPGSLNTNPNSALADQAAAAAAAKAAADAAAAAAAAKANAAGGGMPASAGAPPLSGAAAAGMSAGRESNTIIQEPTPTVYAMPTGPAKVPGATPDKDVKPPTPPAGDATQ